MEENEEHNNKSGIPPNPFASDYRKWLTNDRGAAPSKRSLVRHPSLVSFLFYSEMGPTFVYYCAI